MLFPSFLAQVIECTPGSSLGQRRQTAVMITVITMTAVVIETLEAVLIGVSVMCSQLIRDFPDGLRPATIAGLFGDCISV